MHYAFESAETSIRFKRKWDKPAEINNICCTLYEFNYASGPDTTDNSVTIRHGVIVICNCNCL